MVTEQPYYANPRTELPTAGEIEEIHEEAMAELLLGDADSNWEVVLEALDLIPLFQKHPAFRVVGQDKEVEHG